MKPTWMQKFYARHGVWPIAGGAGEDDPPEPDDDPAEEEDDPDPRIKELSDEAAKYRVRAKEATTRADTAEEQLQAARVELAVRREAAARERPFADLDVVLQLVDVTVGDDGEPVEVGAALDRLADRHPYLLADDQPAPTRVDPSQHVASGTSFNRDTNNRQDKPGLDHARLAAKYPALKGRFKMR